MTKVLEEFLFGGSSASFACLFTNPLEVIKTRLQLQGELKIKGSYKIHYKNFLHALYIIGKRDGVTALQSGLVSGLWYQFFMNGTRLGSYQLLATLKLHYKGDSVSFPRAVIMGASCGALGAFIGSPLYLVKTHMQARSNSEIAVGFQRNRSSTLNALKDIYNVKGISGLWRGWQAQVIRVMMGSSAQLSSFSKCKSLLHEHKICDIESLSNSFLASCVSVVAVTIAMTPFDVMSTRIFNQPLDDAGHGKYYSGIMDALLKVVQIEGPSALYKGATAVFIRLSPHTIITLIVWDRSRQLYNRVQSVDDAKFSTG